MSFAFQLLLASEVPEDSGLMKYIVLYTQYGLNIVSVGNTSPEAKPSIQSFSHHHALISAGGQWMGRFHALLKPIQHEHLCSYVDLVQMDHERFFLVGEDWDRCIRQTTDMRFVQDLIVYH